MKETKEMGRLIAYFPGIYLRNMQQKGHTAKYLGIIYKICKKPHINHKKTQVLHINRKNEHRCYILIVKMNTDVTY